MKKQLYIAALLLTGALAACQNDENAYENDPNAVRIRAGIAAPQARVNTAGEGDEWTDGDRIVVVNTSPNAVTGKSTAGYTYSGGLWDLTGSTYMVWADGTNSFQAWYPGTEGTTFDTFVLPKNQTDNERGTGKHFIGDADWMLATAGSEQTSALDLTFDHQLAKVTVTITHYNDQYPSNVTVESPVFAVPTVPAAITGKTLSVEDGATTVNGLMTGGTDGLHSFTAVLLPGTYSASDNFLQLTVAGETLTVKAGSNALLTSTGLQAGMAYTFNLTVGKNSLGITGVTVSAWGSGWEKGGTATEALTVNATTHTIKTTAAAQINSDRMAEAIGTGNKLIIEGPMDDTDIEALKTYLVANPNAALELDLSKVTELTAFPSYGFSQYDNGSTLGLKSIVLPDVMTKIDGNAFSGYCTELESVTLPAGLKEIGWAAFSNCSKLSTIKVAGKETINELPEGLTTLKDAAFRNTKLETITIPSSLTTVTLSTLRAMPSLTTVYWKSSAAVPFWCFCECTSLTDIYFTSETAPTVGNNLGNDIFGDLPQEITIHIPVAYKDNYLAWNALENNTEGWNITCVTE